MCVRACACVSVFCCWFPPFSLLVESFVVELYLQNFWSLRSEVGSPLILGLVKSTFGSESVKTHLYSCTQLDNFQENCRTQVVDYSSRIGHSSLKPIQFDFAGDLWIKCGISQNVTDTRCSVLQLSSFIPAPRFLHPSLTRLCQQEKNVNKSYNFTAMSALPCGCPCKKSKQESITSKLLVFLPHKIVCFH